MKNFLLIVSFLFMLPSFAQEESEPPNKHFGVAVNSS